MAPIQNTDKENAGSTSGAQDSKYADVVQRAFHPVVLSLGGGSLSTGTNLLFDFWAKVLKRQKYAHLKRSLGLKAYYVRRVTSLCFSPYGFLVVFWILYM